MVFPVTLGKGTPPCPAREGSEIWEAGEKKLFYLWVLGAKERGWDGRHGTVILGCEIVISGWEGMYLCMGDWGLSVSGFVPMCIYLYICRPTYAYIFVYGDVHPCAGIC